MVRKRCDLSDDRFLGLKNLISIREDRLDDLVQPLQDSGPSQETRASIEKLIKRELVNLNALSDCETLPMSHPLRLGALAASHAFEAVTSGHVEDETFALPEIPRKSPLAPWKMLIRAIPAFPTSERWKSIFIREKIRMTGKLKMVLVR